MHYITFDAQHNTDTHTIPAFIIIFISLNAYTRSISLENLLRTLTFRKNYCTYWIGVRSSYLFRITAIFAGLSPSVLHVAFSDSRKALEVFGHKCSRLSNLKISTNPFGHRKFMSSPSRPSLGTGSTRLRLLPGNRTSHAQIIDLCKGLAQDAAQMQPRERMQAK